VSGIPSQDGSSYSPGSIVFPLQQPTPEKDWNRDTGAGVSIGVAVGAGASVGGIGVGKVVGTLATDSGVVVLQETMISMSMKLSMIILFVICVFRPIDKAFIQ
jgi:hypothetical protein